MHSDHPSLIIAILIPAQPKFTSVSDGAIALCLWSTRYVAQDQPLSDLDYHFCATTDLGSIRCRLSSWRNLSWSRRLAGKPCSPHCNTRSSTYDNFECHLGKRDSIVNGASAISDATPRAHRVCVTTVPAAWATPREERMTSFSPLDRLRLLKILIHAGTCLL